MTDLVTRLRDCAHHARRLIPPRADTIDEAAAEIERLREIIRAADALRGWKALHELGLDIAIVNPAVDPRFSFMTVDHDGRIRMDCSSPHAMARLVGLKDRYRVAFANDPDADGHGIVTPAAGLMNPNHYLAVAIRYLLTNRPLWPVEVRLARRWSAAA